MPVSTVFANPIMIGLFINLFSTAIAGGLNKVAHKAFRAEEIEDYLNKISYNEILERNIDLEEISDNDVRALEVFFGSDEIIEIISQIYVDSSEKTFSEIEDDFVQVFIRIKPLNEKSNDELGRKLFLYFNNACKSVIQAKIVENELIAHEYASISRQRESNESHARTEKGIEKIINILETSPRDISSNDTIEYIDDALKVSIDLIENKQFEEAKAKINYINESLEKNPQANKELLSKSYHLLAIIYNRSSEVGGDYEMAKEYASRSLELVSSNKKVEGTLASVYINRGLEGDREKAISIIKPLWENPDENNPQFLEVYLWGLFFTISASGAIDFFESSEKAQRIARDHDILSNVIAQYYLQIGNPRQSLPYINNAIRLKPDNSDHYSIKASAYREIALREDSSFSYFELIPRLKKNDCVEYALKNYQKALSLHDGTAGFYIKDRIKKEIYICSSMLNRSNEKEYQQNRFSICPSSLDENEQKTLECIDFGNEFNQRNFDAAYSKLISLRDWDKMSYETKIKFGQMFLHQGNPENAKKIFVYLEEEAEKREDILYWLDLSFIEGLLGNKTKLLYYLRKAKFFSKGTEHEERVLSHNFSMVNRFRESRKETDRMLSTIQEYDKKFPNRKLLKKIPVMENESKPNQEIVNFFSRAVERDQNIKKIYNDSLIPIYPLEKILNYPFVELLSSFKDPNFHLKYYPSSSLELDKIDSFETTGTFIFDYSSLLNLSKMDILGEIERICGKLAITKSLFDKIQTELILYENEDLRKLWDFLRNSNIVSVIDSEVDLSKYDTISELLEGWIIDTIDLILKTENCMLISDDYGFINLLFKEYKINGNITINFLEYLLENEYIDSKSYGIAIGVLAERMYIVLRFDGEDLYNIVMDDNCEIQLRSYHLINHITIPEIWPIEYTEKFDFFIEKLWRSGSLFEEKIKWLSLITERIIQTIIQRRELKQIPIVILLKLDLTKIWKDAIYLSKFADLDTIEKECNSLLDEEFLKPQKDSIQSVINQRRIDLSILAFFSNYSMWDIGSAS